MHRDEQPPEQIEQAIAAREEAFRFAMVCFLASGGALERAQQLCAEIDREIEDAVPAREVVGR
jgi:hypothetical protein